MGVALAFAAYLAYVAATSLYAFSTAAAGRVFGIGVRKVTVGFGPTVFRRVVNGCEYRLCLFHFGSSTAFLGQGDDDEPLPPVSGKRFDEAHPFARVVVALTGPLLNVVLALLLLGLPVWAGGSRLRAASPEESNVFPRAVPGLAVDTEPATWDDQWRLFREIGVEYVIRLATFRSLSGWGGHYGALVTCGAAGRVSPWTWVSALGVLILLYGVMCLMPIPLQNGFHMVRSLAEPVVGKFSEKLTFRLNLAGLLVLMTGLARMFWADLTWLIGQFV